MDIGVLGIKFQCLFLEYEHLERAHLGDLHLGLHPVVAVPGHPAGEVVGAGVPGRRPGDGAGGGGGGGEAGAGGVGRQVSHLHQVMARSPGEGHIGPWGCRCQLPVWNNRLWGLLEKCKTFLKPALIGKI